MEIQYAFIAIDFHGDEIEINAEFNSPNLVVINEHSLPQQQSFGTTLINRIEIEEFNRDILLIFATLIDMNSLEPMSIITATKMAANHHIHNYGRLVINDLHAFADEATLILKNIDVHKKIERPKKYYHDYWKKTEMALLSEFKEWVWVVSPLGHGLVKYNPR